jgi:hypothetical protein
MRPELLIRNWIAAAILLGAVGACGPLCGNGKLNLTNPQIDPTSFTCPVAADGYQYAMNGTVDADNQSSRNITIQSAATDATVTKLNGNWGIAVGAKSGDQNVSITPSSIGSGSKARITFRTVWSCTNTATQPNTYADFSLVLTMSTSAGNYTVKLPSHRLKMA